MKNKSFTQNKSIRSNYQLPPRHDEFIPNRIKPGNNPLNAQPFSNVLSINKVKADDDDLEMYLGW